MPKLEPDSSLSPFQQWREKWRSGCGAGICGTANRVVLCRGKVPADVIFIGQAPGHSENVLGRPFVGPAGFLLDHIIAKAVPGQVRYAITNLVGCIPLDDDGEEGEPNPDEVKQCAPRLQEFIELCNPKLIVTVGNQARDYLDQKMMGGVKLRKPIQQVDIHHPAYILRQPIAHQSLMTNRCAVAIVMAIRHYVTGE